MSFAGSVPHAVEKGLALPVMEHFYSLQGEGIHSGRAAYFIRLAGCDVGCHWCDVKASWTVAEHPVYDLEAVVNLVDPRASIVVITGGEPLLYELKPLTQALRKRGFETHLETSGAYPLRGEWDWICLSPKKRKPPLEQAVLNADELKCIIYNQSDYTFAEACAKGVKQGCHRLLQPEWSRRQAVLPALIQYVKRNPKWRVSLQTHKFMQID